MCKIRWAKERILTWQILTASLDQRAYNRRLRQLDKRYNKLVADYEELLTTMKEDYKNDRVSVDSSAG